MGRDHYIFLTIVITLCVLCGCSTGETAQTGPPALTAGERSAIIAQAEALFRQREDVSKLQEAVNTLGKARDWSNPDFETEWKFARMSYFLGKQVADRKQAEPIFGRGRDAGAIAARLSPERAEGHFWFGANLGELARMDPLVTGISSVGEIRAAMNKVIEIEPGYQNSSAYDALAQIELETRLTGGSAARAAELLQTALETERENADLHLRLATALLALKRNDEARKQLDILLRMRPNPEYGIEYRQSIAEARKMLETRF